MEGTALGAALTGPGSVDGRPTQVGESTFDVFTMGSFWKGRVARRVFPTGLAPLNG